MGRWVSRVSMVGTDCRFLFCTSELPPLKMIMILCGSDDGFPNGVACFPAEKKKAEFQAAEWRGM
jgi:hypothetical protein